VLPDIVVELVEGGVSTDPFGLPVERRCQLQAGTSPSLLPGWLGDGRLPSSLSATKVVVFCADPRFGLDLSEAGSQSAVLELDGPVARNVQDLAEWAELENSWPEQVRLFFVEDFVSDAEAAMRHLVQFLGVRAASGKILAQLQDAAMQGSAQIAKVQQELSKLATMEELFMPWLSSPNAFLQDFGERLQQEIASQAANAELALPTGRDWSVEHATSTCNPCIFAMRNTCRNGDACQHCHLPGHAKPKRASKKKRDQKKERLARLCRTPSPEWRAYDAQPARSLPALPLPSQACMQPVLATPAFFIPIYCN